tara:strand:- start:1015 stop:1656 length:642 start_codon:yes stop_codon:yes gene_type:complete
MELGSTNLNKSKSFAKKIGILDELPSFENNYKLAQKIVSVGRTQRKDMPVINDNDVKEFQSRLKSGEIDIRTPFSKTTKTKDPFPQGLGGYEAKDFLERGLKDGSKSDDVIGVTIKQIPVKKLKPIQKQIYYDKSIKSTARFGIGKITDFLTKKSFFIISDDNYIIDGHHRFLSAMLVNPDMKVHALSIDLPIKELLPMSLAYGDAIGNTRNA